MQWSLNDQIIQSFSLLQSLHTRLRSLALEGSKREIERSWWIFALRVFFLFLQCFFRAYIPTLPLMTVGELQLAVVREIQMKVELLQSAGGAINASAE